MTTNPPTIDAAGWLRNHSEFGYRFLADEIRAGGHRVCDRTVWAHCAANGWWSVFGKPKTRKNTKPGTPAHDDLVRRVFTTDRAEPAVAHRYHRAPYRRRQAVFVRGQRRLLETDRGYSIGDRMKASLVVAALNNAVAMRGGVAGCILHSDRGSQFRSRRLKRALVCHGMVGSMGRVGTAPPWNRSSRSFNATSWTNNVGPP